MSSTPPVYNDATFRQQFPAFGSTTLYPEAALSFAWSMAGSWLNENCQAGWGLQGAKWQQAADLMAAVITRQLYGPTLNSTTASTGTPSPLGNVVAGPVTNASDNGTSASIKVPEFGSSAFMAMLLASPPYGTLLLSLLQVAAGVGAYIPSCRFAFVPP